MMKILGTLNRNLAVAIPAAMALGFAVGMVMDARVLKGGILPLTFLMVYPMMVTMKLRKILEGGDGKAQAMAQAMNFGIVPFAAFGLGLAFFPGRPFLALGLLLAALVPTSGMTIAWTGFAKGNVEAAVKMTVVGLILGSLLTPLYLNSLLGAKVAVDLPAVFGQILLTVFLPMAAGYATQRALVRRYGQRDFEKRLAPRFPAFSTLGVLGIVFVAVALKAREIAAHPLLVGEVLVPVILLYGGNYLLGALAGKTFLNREDAIALVYGTVMRNLSIAMAVAMNAFGEAGAEAALVICAAYLVQVQSAAWSVGWVKRFFEPRILPVAAPEES
ncbi:MAG: arsenic resistance protein [Syntrophaceae bacterium]|nr:arsenic resistance protein [Syntrophaceae bacterium]